MLTVKSSTNLIRTVHILDAYHNVEANKDGSIPFPQQHKAHNVNAAAIIGVIMVNIQRILLAGRVAGVVVVVTPPVVVVEDVVVVEVGLGGSVQFSPN